MGVAGSVAFSSAPAKLVKDEGCCSLGEGHAVPITVVKRIIFKAGWIYKIIPETCPSAFAEFCRVYDARFFNCASFTLLPNYWFCKIVIGKLILAFLDGH